MTDTQVLPKQEQTVQKVRLGFLAPAVTFDTYPLAMYKASPKGVLWLCASNNVDEFNKANLEKNLQAMDDLVTQLALDGAEFIIIGGSPAFRGKSPEYAEQVMQRLKEKTGVPVTTNANTPLDALRHLGVKRVALASPYPEWTDQEMHTFMKASGFEVTGSRFLNCQEIVDFANVPLSTSYDLIIEAARSGGDPEGVYVPCARLPVVDVIEQAEKELGIPVVTAATSMVWAGLRGVGWQGEPVTMFGQPFSKYGRLMDTINPIA